MLRAIAFPAPYNSVPVLSGTNTCHSLEQTRVFHYLSSFTSRFEFRQFRQPRVKGLRGGGFVPAAAKKQGCDSASLAGVDEGFDDYEDVDYEVEDDDDDGDEEEMVPFEQMRKWFEKRQKGFGEGKVYDTSLEDKLLEEMWQSREAQAANVKKLKENPVKPAFNKNGLKKKDVESVPFGGRVRLENLPEKKNIHRDLKAAFQGIRGIMNIIPAVAVNKKTRDPICKGFAFVDFKHEEDAVRFVELYAGQTITFGKIQKQIKCELLNAMSSSSSFSFSSLELSKNLNTAPHLMVSAFEEDSNGDSNMDDSALSSWDGTNSDDSDEQQESDGENQEFVTALKVDFDDSMEMRIDSEINSLLSEQVNRNPTAEQKSPAKVRQENAPNNIWTLTKINYVSGNVKSQFPIYRSEFHHQIRFSHLAPICATLRGPRGFGPPPKKKKKTKKLRENYGEDDDEEEEEEEGEEEEPDQGVIPEVVTNRMISRMAFSVGIPLGIGLLFFPFFYYLKVGLKIDVPTWVPFIVSFFFFGSALLGVSYGIVSSSWDPLREGSLLGWNEAQKNWPVFWQSLWGGSRKR